MARSKGVSRSVEVSGPYTKPSASNPIHGSTAHRRTAYGPQAIEKAKLEAAERYERTTAGLSTASLRILATMRGEKPPPVEDSYQDAVMLDADDGDGEWVDEADDEKGATVEESMAHALRDLMENRPLYRRYKDMRTWGRRIRAMDANWQPLVPRLVTAYLEWECSSSLPRSSPSRATPEDLPSSDAQDAEQPASEPATAHPTSDSPIADSPSSPAATDGVSNSPETRYDFEVEVLDVYSAARTATIPRAAHDLSAAEALVRHGYLGTVPVNPSLAISLKTLELFRILRLFKPSLSVEAFTKVVCYIYRSPYRRYYRTAISDAFDIYLTILRSIKEQVQAALGRNTPNWRALNSCPPCSYELKGETPATFARLLVMDGNNSLKRLAPISGRAQGDTRTFEGSDYFLRNAFVNQFAGEVKARQAQHHVDVPMGTSANHAGAGADDDSHDDPTPEHDDTPADAAEDGDPTDGADLSSCTTNWKAAASEEQKRMWSIFDECGVFACSCRHGLLLWIADMVRSGELAKYPLAMVAMINQVLGVRVGLGYDIGCSLDTTLRHTSVGPAFFAAGSRMIVNAFHGYSHAYPCQICFHPNIISGMGLEDLETLERTFSASNQLASVTRHATPYRRRVLIDLFFQQWDDEKYQNLALMLYNNYVQALEIIDDLSPVVNEAMQSLGISTSDLQTFEKEERAYFASLTDEDSWDVHAVAYVDALQRLSACEEQYRMTNTQFYGTVRQDYQWLPPERGPTQYAAALSTTRKLETSRRVLSEKIDNLKAEVIGMELRLNITTRWRPGHQEYDDTVKYISSRRYHQSLGKLQRLVIQRLFELHKLNLSQTAYRVRSFIAKNLQKRCQAIRRAVDEYNKAAAELNPPRPALDWSKVSHFSFIEEFTLLQDTRNDLRDKPWATPIARETLRKARRIEHAREEIANVNREVRRLHTSIRDEDLHFKTVLDDLRAQQAPIYPFVLDFCTRRRAANAHNLVYIQRLYDLDGFTGDPSPGVRRSAAAPVPPSAPTSSTEGMAAPSSLPAQSPITTTTVVSSASLRTLQDMTAAEAGEVAKDEGNAEIEADEEDVLEVAGIVDHMANVAASM